MKVLKKYCFYILILYIVRFILYSYFYLSGILFRYNTYTSGIPHKLIK